MKEYAVKVIANARTTGVQDEGDHLKVKVTVPAEGGKANKAVIKALAKHFGVKANQVEIVKGEFGRKKVVRVGI